MILYAQIVNDITKQCNVGTGTNEDFYKSIGMEKMDVEESWDGKWFLAGYAPEKPHKEEIQEQIFALEKEVTDRNIRAAILGDSYAINKITNIEAAIDELRRQLESLEAQ